jgi:hypothetical protein
MNYSGVVTKVIKRTHTKAGKEMRSPAYSVNMDDSEWFSFGFSNPGVSEGDAITFNYSKGQFGNEGDADSVDVAENSNAPAAKKAVVSADTRQNSIVYQSSLKVAAELLPFLVESGAVKMPKQALQYDFLIDVLESTAKRLAREALDPDLSETVEKSQVDADIDE